MGFSKYAVQPLIATPIPQPAIGQMGQKVPPPFTAQMTTSRAFTITYIAR